ncbi:MAG: hypothetical protein PF505_09585, partial [Vallitaleaceae bacterium]|nr:hypothetical protein [Vallitaleaceae bacterium]
FWEGITDKEWDIKEGFVVSKSDLITFLQDKLEYIGLTPAEYNEFIVYWLPKLGDNEYTLIYFASEEYVEIAKLIIEPEPESVLRVFMVAKAMDRYIEIPEQELDTFEREGFTVIEWGGTLIKD